MLDLLRTDKGMVMARNTSVTIGDHFASFISEQVQAGRYGSTSDVVRAGLRLLEENEARVKALEAALIEGEESGEPQPFDFEAFKARKRAEYAAR
jgi:antitoxin ParD1/3/4